MNRPLLGTQARTVYDYAEEWHDRQRHPEDVRECAACRPGNIPRSPYGVMLDYFWPLLTVEAP